MSAQEPVSRASVRAPSGDVTAAASAGVKWRTTEELVPPSKLMVVPAGQMSRIAVALGAVMVTVTAARA